MNANVPTGSPRVYWVLRSPEGRALHCTLHQVDLVYELRVATGVQPPLRTQRVPTLDAAARVAEQLRKLALDHGYLESTLKTPGSDA